MFPHYRDTNVTPDLNNIPLSSSAVFYWVTEHCSGPQHPGDREVCGRCSHPRLCDQREGPEQQGGTAEAVDTKAGVTRAEESDSPRLGEAERKQASAADGQCHALCPQGRPRLLQPL